MNARPRIVLDRIAHALVRRSAVVVSTISLFELSYGIAKSTLREGNTKTLRTFLEPLRLIPFDEEDAAAAGDIRAGLERIGKPIGPYDCLIAAQALRRDLTLVTANVREFSRVEGLRWEDWTA